MKPKAFICFTAIILAISVTLISPANAGKTKFLSFGTGSPAGTYYFLGAGFASIGLAHLVGDSGKVLSVDLQPEMLYMVKARVQKNELGNIIQTHKCDADSLNVDGMFDFVNAFWVVHEVPDFKNFLREIYSHLNPRGRLFIAEPMYHVTGPGFKKLIDTAEGIGFSFETKPFILLSMAVVLKKKEK